MSDSRQWKISRFNSVRGPFSFEQISDLIQAGRLSPQDFITVSADGKKEEWQILSQVHLFRDCFQKNISPQSDVTFCPYIPESKPANALAKESLDDDHASVSSRPIEESLAEGGADFEASLFETARPSDSGNRGTGEFQRPQAMETKLDTGPGLFSSSAFKFAVAGLAATVVVIYGSLQWLGSTSDSRDPASVESKSNPSASDASGTSNMPQTVLNPSKTSNYIRKGGPRVAPQVRLPSHLNRGTDAYNAAPSQPEPEYRNDYPDSQEAMDGAMEPSMPRVEDGAAVRYGQNRFRTRNAMAPQSEDEYIDRMPSSEEGDLTEEDAEMQSGPPDYDDALEKE